MNLTAFASEIRDPIGVRDASTAVPRVELVNLRSRTNTKGAELLARWHAEPFRTTVTYTYTLGEEPYPEFDISSPTANMPRHQAGLVASYEQEDVMRAGLEVYFTSRMPLRDNPYRGYSTGYFYVGALAERAFGAVRLFVNAENLLDVRQSDWDPLVRPTMGRGGGWTTDVWAPLDGFVVNAGIRWSLSVHE